MARPRSAAAALNLESLLSPIALALPGVTQGVACAGTSLESRTFCVGDKAFLFVRAADARLKLRASLAEAVECAERFPDACQASASGWVKLLAGGATLPRELLQRWVAESHGLVGPRPARNAAARTAPRARKKTARR